MVQRPPRGATGAPPTGTQLGNATPTGDHCGRVDDAFYNTAPAAFPSTEVFGQFNDDTLLDVAVLDSTGSIMIVRQQPHPSPRSSV